MQPALAEVWAYWLALAAEEVGLEVRLYLPVQQALAVALAFLASELQVERLEVEALGNLLVAGVRPLEAPVPQASLAEVPASR